MRFHHATFLLLLASLYAVDGFTTSSSVGLDRCQYVPATFLSQQRRRPQLLFAKKKAKKPLVNLDQLDLWDEEEEAETGGSKKLTKKQLRAQKAGIAVETEQDDLPANNKKEVNGKPAMSKKEAKIAAMLALEELDAKSNEAKADDPYAGMSKKEIKDAKKKEEKKARQLAAKEAKKAARKAEMEATNGDSSEETVPGVEKGKPAMSKKEAKIAAMLALEELDAQSNESKADDPYAGMSKKEIKDAKKKEEKKARQLAAKEAKKAANRASLEEIPEDGGSEVNGSAVTSPPAEEVKPKKLTAEERIKKERPPPRIRVMEGVQPGYVSLRLENVAVTFRNQDVLKDVTWGVQTGDRVGLVGANGGGMKIVLCKLFLLTFSITKYVHFEGKTTQLRILNGDLEPTTGDVLKSSKDLRVAMLRQEFVDELVLDRTLKEEFMSVFEEEAKILADLRSCEDELANVGDDTEKMQDILDRMQKLQGKADAKEVYNLESRVEKVMNLMGYNPEEGQDLVRSFSGGWKMRIGLGKVLLKDPNILLLDEPSNHLDLESIEWLEEFLRSQTIPMVIVSHDREFLDQVCTKIVDTEAGVSYEYNGNYSRFLKLKKGKIQFVV